MMFDDLTEVNVPFGLLDAETQAALKAHGGPYQLWEGTHWATRSDKPVFDGWYTYRVKPQPPKPREWWLTSCGGYLHTFADLAAAETYRDCNRNVSIIHVREVLP
jgi:hypothetical protein